MNFFDKEMRLFGKYGKIACFFYLMAATVLFYFWLFPEAEVREFIERGAGRINPDLSIGVGDVRPSFPPSFIFRDVSLSYKGDPVADPAYIRVTPGLFSLFGRSPLFSFKSGISGGIIHGDCQFMEDRGAHADVRVSGLKLENIDFLRAMSQHRLSGLLGGTLKVKSDGADIQSDSNIVLSDITVTLAQPVLGMQAMQFDAVEADLSTTPRRIEIKACTMKGQEVAGEFTGHILVRQPYEKSLLNLNGFLKPQAAFIKKAGMSLPVETFMKNEPGEKGFPVRLTGSFQSPEIVFR